MSQQALPFGTPSEPGQDPIADAIERALLAADLRDAQDDAAPSAEPGLASEQDAPTDRD